MHVSVGSQKYELRVVRGKLVLNGQTCGSLVDHDRSEILISDTVPVGLRMDVAAQAVSEAWAHQVAKQPTLPYVGPVS